MVGKLGIVVLCVAALTACTPGVYEGHVIAGLDDNGTLVAVLGTCDDEEFIMLDIVEDLPEEPPPTKPYPTETRPPPKQFARAEHTESTEPMRVELRRDQAPQGWSSKVWQLPDQGKIAIFAWTQVKRDGQASQYLDYAKVDMGALAPLPANAEDLATEDC